MKNAQHYLSKIDTYLEQAKKISDHEKREVLLQISHDILDMLKELTGNDIDLQTEIANRLIELDSIKNKKEKFAGIKNFVTNHKKLTALATAGAITLGTLGGCAAFQTTANDNVTVVEANENSTEFDTERYSMNPLEGKSLISEGTSFAESLAKNGAYDKEGYGPEMYALLGVLNTNGSMSGKDDFIKNIDLEDYFAEAGDLNKAINQMDELTEKVVRARGDMDWAKIVPHKKSASMLEKAEKLYNEAGAKATEEQKQAWNKFINDEIIADLEQYSPFTIMMVQHYITMATDAHLMTPEQRDLFYKDLDNVCNTNQNVCGVKDKEGVVGAEDTIYSTSKRIAVTYLESLLQNKEEHKHAEGEVYYSFDEVTKGIKNNIKNLKNADIDIEAKGREEAIKNIDAITSSKYPGMIVSENDPHINHATGTYDTNEHIGGGNQVGDSIDMPNLDANGNETNQSTDELIDYSNQAAIDFNNGQYKNEHLYNTQPAYKATWDAMKKAYDDAMVPPPADDNIVDENEHEEEHYYPSSNNGTIQQSESTETTEENYYSDYVLGDDGQYYLNGQLPTGVNPASFIEDTMSKTR